MKLLIAFFKDKTREIIGVWGLLKYLQCNKANAEKFQNIFMWNALILVLVEMPKFKFVCALMVILSLGGV